MEQNKVLIERLPPSARKAIDARHPTLKAQTRMKPTHQALPGCRIYRRRHECVEHTNTWDDVGADPRHQQDTIDGTQSRYEAVVRS